MSRGPVIPPPPTEDPCRAGGAGRWRFAQELRNLLFPPLPQATALRCV